MALSDAAVVDLARDLYPEVTTAAASDALLLAWVPWARALVGASSWLGSYDLGVALLLAHVGIRDSALLGGGAKVPPGPMTSITTLGMSTSFGSAAAAGSSLDNELSTTKAGARWLSIRSTLADANILPAFL